MTISGERCLVTGAAGFIGSHLVERLLAEGCVVTGLDNLRWGLRERIVRFLDHPRFTFIERDLRDRDGLAEIVRGHSVVFHLAASADVRKGTEDTRLDLENCTTVTANMLEAMRQADVRKILFTSSGTVYGEAPVEPVRETELKLLPISLYGSAKLACEAEISAYCHLFDMQAWIFRCGQIVGGSMRRGVLYDLIEKLRKDSSELEVLGDGKQVKSYLLIEEFLDAVLFAYDHASFPRSEHRCEVFNLASESPMTVAQVSKLVVEEAGTPQTRIRYTGGRRGWPGDVPVIRFNMDKMRAMGWEPKHESSVAVRTCVRRLIGKE